MIVIGLYDHADDVTALVQIRVPHRVGDDLADGEADVVESSSPAPVSGMPSFSAERARSGALLFTGRITSLRRMATHLAVLALRVCV